jgi:pSer/pThr/pTyr-binding forkhead associated (FHA) protein
VRRRRNHPSVSRVHAEIHALGDGRYEIVDRESANGVRVNGVELPNSILDARDVVELGDVIMKFFPAGEIYIPGADETFHPPPVATGMSTLSTGTKLGIFAGLVVAVGVVVAVMALGSGESARAPVAQGEGDGSARTLTDAKSLLARGDAQGAMERADQIPQSSNLRNSKEFKLIQSAWADDLFGKAAASNDPAEKRSILDRIARSSTLDPTRRKRAANEPDAMRQAAVNVADLPSEQGISVEASDSAAPAAPVAEADDKSGAAKKPAAPMAGKAPAPVAKTAPQPAPSKPAKPPSGATLVRQNPFDDP